MREKFKLGEVGVSLFHGHGQEDASECRVKNGM